MGAKRKLMRRMCLPGMLVAGLIGSLTQSWLVFVLGLLAAA